MDIYVLPSQKTLGAMQLVNRGIIYLVNFLPVWKVYWFLLLFPNIFGAIVYNFHKNFKLLLFSKLCLCYNDTIAVEEDLFLSKKLTYFLSFNLVIIFIALGAMLYFHWFSSPSQRNQSQEDLWVDEMNYVEIPSTLDGEIQEAYFLSSTEEAPLIISLHQWTATYENFDPISNMAIEENWNYIRPNFRGPNIQPKAGGSEYVLSDIDDAIAYAKENSNVQTDNIYIVGTSGGGHAALMHLMNSEIEVSGYSAWVPITDLIAWYGESRLRDNKYSDDILAITNSQNNRLDIQEARNRSPIHQDTPVDKLEDTEVHLFAGVHDGYDGTVPIGHTLNFYNKLITDLEYGEEHLIPYDVESQLLYTQTLHELDEEHDYPMIGNRNIIYETGVENINLTIFDGHHEILYEEAFGLLNHIPE